MVKKMDIAACMDKWFVMPTGVMMQSVCVNNPEVDIVFHIITDDNVTEANKRDIEGIVLPFGGKSVRFYPYADYLHNKSFPRGLDRHDITNTAYFRLFIPEILPQTIDKVLYFDGDVIVRHSLLPLWETDLQNHAVAVVPDVIEGDFQVFNRLNYPPQMGYFNSGVILINLKNWRETAVVEEFVAYIREHPNEIVWHDQDVLNAVLWKRKITLPIKYNLIGGYLWKDHEYDYLKYEQEILEARRDPVIIHFTGDKPWSRYQRNRHPFSSTFYKYQNQTKWKGVKTERRPWKLRIINFVADALRRWGVKAPDGFWGYIDIAPID